MNILTHKRGQVYLFAPGEFDLHGKRVRNDLFFRVFEAYDALHADPDGEPAGGKKPPFADADIQGIRQGGDRRGPGLLQVQPGRILLPLEMEGLSLRNLKKMDFHWTPRDLAPAVCPVNGKGFLASASGMASMENQYGPLMNGRTSFS